MAMPAVQRSELGKDLRSFIQFLEKFYPNEILRVKEKVDPFFGVTSILWRLENERRFPIVIFDNIIGSTFPCVTNVHASFPRLAMAARSTSLARVQPPPRLQWGTLIGVTS